MSRISDKIDEIFDIDGDLYHPDKYKGIKVNDAFREWFKDGGITDSYHDPLIVYHGTNKNFNSFIAY